MPKIYTVEDCLREIPILLQRMALLEIDTVMKLDSYPMHSRMIEKNILALHGYHAQLMKLCYIVWKAYGHARADEWLEQRRITEGDISTHT